MLSLMILVYQKGRCSLLCTLILKMARMFVRTLKDIKEGFELVRKMSEKKKKIIEKVNLGE